MWASQQLVVTLTIFHPSKRGGKELGNIASTDKGLLMNAENNPEYEDQDRTPNRVREFRENKLMTQAQLARKSNVSRRTIHSIERGNNCRMDTKRKVLLGLGLSLEDQDQLFPPTRH